MRFDGTKSQYVYQWISNPTPTWTMDCLFAIGSNFTGSGTKFKVDIFHNDLAGSKVSVGVNNLGQFGIYNGGTFTILPELGTVAFSVDNNGNGNFTDPGDTLNVYRLRIVGNYANASPYVNIYTSEPNIRCASWQATWSRGRKLLFGNDSQIKILPALSGQFLNDAPKRSAMLTMKFRRKFLNKESRDECCIGKQWGRAYEFAS